MQEITNRPSTLLLQTSLTSSNGLTASNVLNASNGVVNFSTRKTCDDEKLQTTLVTDVRQAQTTLSPRLRRTHSLIVTTRPTPTLDTSNASRARSRSTTSTPTTTTPTGTDTIKLFAFLKRYSKLDRSPIIQYFYDHNVRLQSCAD